jgi:hypothetical protein
VTVPSAVARMPWVQSFASSVRRARNGGRGSRLVDGAADANRRERKPQTQGLSAGRLTRTQIVALECTLQSSYRLYNPSQFSTFARGAAVAEITGFPTGGENFDLMLLFTTATKGAQRGSMTMIAGSGAKGDRR